MRSRITYANVTATLALFFAMSGGALATKHYLIESTKQINPKVLKKLKGASGKTGVAGPQGKEGPPGKEGKEGKESTNAQSLGGIPASGYTRSACSSNTGQIKGSALIPEGLSSTFTTLSGAYNCSGQAVEAKKVATGLYVIKFVGSPVTIAVGNVVDQAGATDDAFVSFTQLSAGEFEVIVYNAVLKAGEERPVSVVTP